MRRRRLLPLFALALASAPEVARAEPQTGVALQLDPGLTLARTVRDVSAPSTDINVMPGVSVAGELTRGWGVVGIDLGGAWGWSAYRFDGFAGVVAGAELAGGQILVRMVGEGGVHVMTGTGSTFLNDAHVPVVALPYLGARVGEETQLTRGRRAFSMGASAFVRFDAEHRVVSGTLDHHCAPLDFYCAPSTYPIVREAGGVMVGFSVSMTWWSDAWFRPPAG